LLLQRLLFRAVLWSLGFAALIGGLAVLIADPDITGRVALTCAFAGLAALVAVPLSRPLDTPEHQRSAAIHLVLVVLSFLLTLLAVWSEHIASSWKEEIIVSAALLTLLFIPAGLCVRLIEHPPHRLAGLVGAALACVEAILVLLAIWLRPLAQTTTDQWGKTAASLAGIFALAILCLVDEPTKRPWRWIGIASCVAAGAVAIAGIWFVPSNEPKWFVALLTAAIFIACANVISMAPLMPRVEWVRTGSIIAGACTGIAANLPLWLAPDAPAREWCERLSAAAGIATSSGTLAVVVLWAFARRSRALSLLPTQEIRSVSLDCPGCGKRQSLPLGRSACPHCRLEFSLSIHWPACPACGYSLRGLRVERCPECGGSVVESPMPPTS
jgi:hypothetical protein